MKCDICSLEKERTASISELNKDFFRLVESFSHLFIKEEKPHIQNYENKNQEKQAEIIEWKDNDSILFIVDSLLKDTNDHFHLSGLRIEGEFRKKMEEESASKKPYWLIAKLLSQRGIIEMSLASLTEKVENVCLDDLAKEIKSAIKLRWEKTASKKLQNLETKVKTLEKNEKKLKRELRPLEIRKRWKQEERKELENLRKRYLEKDWYIPLTKKQREKIVEEKELVLLEYYVRETIIKDRDAIKKLAENTIYEFNSWKYYIGWPAFLISGAVAIKWVRKINKKKSKPTTNLHKEIQEKFNLWRLNMFLSVAAYVVSFFLLKNAIDKWLRPNIYGWLENNENVTTASVTILLGVLFLADGYISSELKTPLQRLSIKIESADINEKEKKSLLSKTQQSNETFKETLKRFGLLSIAGMTIKLLGETFDNNKFSLFCYGVPIAFGIWRIWQVSRAIKKIKKKK